jgi:hypothetical protein
VIRAFAHDLKLPMTLRWPDTENLLIEAVMLSCQAGEDETLTKLLIDFTMEKQMMINPGIFRGRFWTRGVWFLWKSPKWNHLSR